MAAMALKVDPFTPNTPIDEPARFSGRDNELKAIACPTICLWGVDDSAAPLAQGRIAADLVTGSRLVVLQTGHDPHLSHPACVRQLVSELRQECA